MTDVEQVLWTALRNRQLGGFKFRRQATIGRYVADFLCAERKLIAELDGGQHSSDADAPRTTALEEAGYRIIRFWNSDVIQSLDGVLETILGALQEERPSPNPLPQAGEGYGQQMASCPAIRICPCRVALPQRPGRRLPRPLAVCGHRV